MFRIDVIISINNSIIISISSHIISGNIFNILTGPSIWTIKWTITRNLWISSTVFHSPFIFNVDDTGMNFTRIDNSIHVFITVFNENIIMFSINVVAIINNLITVGIISLDNFLGDDMDISTSPFTFTGNWTFTLDMTSFWTVSISPSVF